MSEPGYTIENVHLRMPGLAAGRSVRFAHLSDLHVRAGEDRYARMAREVTARDLDFVFLSGDLVTRGDDAWDTMLDMVRGLNARHGVYACRGNWELKYNGPRLAEQKRLLAERGVHLLVNESETVELPAGQVCVAAVDDLVLGWPSFQEALADGADADCTVLLAHAPLAVDMLTGGLHADLVLSGHTHGGQVRIPRLWRAMMPLAAGRYTDGLYEGGEAALYVNRGFGMAGVLNLRFRCPPEVAFFELEGG